MEAIDRSECSPETPTTRSWKVGLGIAGFKSTALQRAQAGEFSWCGYLQIAKAMSSFKYSRPVCTERWFLANIVLPDLLTVGCHSYHQANLNINIILKSC